MVEVHQLLEHQQVDYLVEEEEHQLVVVVYSVVKHLKLHLHQAVFSEEVQQLAVLQHLLLEVECLDLLHLKQHL